MPFAGRKHHGDCRFGGTIVGRYTPYFPYFGVYHFNDSLFPAQALRRERHAAPLQRMAGRLAKLSAFHFQLSIFHSRLPLPCNSPPIKRRPRCGCSGAAGCQKKLSSRKLRREESCERKPSGFPFAFNHPPLRQNCKIMIQKLIFQFWKQLIKKTRRDFFDKLNPCAEKSAHGLQVMRSDSQSRGRRCSASHGRRSRRDTGA